MPPDYPPNQMDEIEAFFDARIGNALPFQFPDIDNVSSSLVYSPEKGMWRYELDITLDPARPPIHLSFPVRIMKYENGFEKVIEAVRQALEQESEGPTLE